MQQLALLVWKLHEEAYNNQTRIGETTVTELLALELKKRGKGWSMVDLTNQREEARTGADMYLVLIGRTGKATAFHIQAKRLDRTQLSYPEFVKTSSMTQLRKLLASATTDELGMGIHAFPLYLLYNSWSGKKLQQQMGNKVLEAAWLGLNAPLLACSTCGEQVQERSYGCSIIPAIKLMDQWVKRGQTSKLTDLLPIMRPWSCLTCCSDSSSGDLAERAAVSMVSEMEGLWKEVNMEEPRLSDHLKDWSGVSAESIMATAKRAVNDSVRSDLGMLLMFDERGMNTN